MIGVVVVDDQALVRAGFKVLVDSAPDLCVVGEAASGFEAIEQVQLSRPDVVLMDVRMPGLDGIEATRQILKANNSASGDKALSTKIIILTTFDLDEYVYDALRAGASGFLLKDTPPAELLNAIRVVAAGEALLAPSVTRRLIIEFANREIPSRASSELLDRLTPRELEVLSLVGKGRSNAEIASELYMSLATAKTHVSRILTKLDSRDRAQLVVIAYESGLMNASRY